MNNIKCGHIFKSKDRVNFFVNDINSLLYIIIPIVNPYNPGLSNLRLLIIL